MNVIVILFFITTLINFVITVFNFFSRPYLRSNLTTSLPLVSILIPARNESEMILTLLSSLVTQDYQNIEVFILDDNSSDDTASIIENFCLSHSNYKLIKGQPLPKGWLGKSFACYQLAKHAKGQYLLFLDADVQIKNKVIYKTIAYVEKKNLSLLSLFSDQIMKTWGEFSVIPLMHYILLSFLPMKLVYQTTLKSLSAANGQFMFFNANHYHTYQWHKLVKNKIVEDIEIMRLVKTKQLKGDVLLANGEIICRMYTSYQEAIKGFSKNLLAGFNYCYFILLIYLIFFIAGPLVTFIWLPNLLSLVGICLIVTTRFLISCMANQNRLTNILMHIPQMANLILISILSFYYSFTKNLLWKGRKI